jgi:hypothetical protein
VRRCGAVGGLLQAGRRFKARRAQSGADSKE